MSKVSYGGQHYFLARRGYCAKNEDAEPKSVCLAIALSSNRLSFLLRSEKTSQVLRASSTAVQTSADSDGGMSE